MSAWLLITAPDYTFLFISHTTNAFLFKFRCNILIGVRIIKEMPGSVASGTPCIKEKKEADSWSEHNFILYVKQLHVSAVLSHPQVEQRNTNKKKL